MKVQPKRKGAKGSQMGENRSEFSTDGRTSVDGNQSDTEGEDGHTLMPDPDEQSGSYPTSPTALPGKVDSKDFYDGKLSASAPVHTLEASPKLEVAEHPTKSYDVTNVTSPIDA